MPEITENLWEPPQKEDKYALGGDVSEGLPHGDASVLEVISCSTGRQVYECYGAIPPFELAERAYLVGTYYNSALCAIENNKDGGCNRALFEMGYRSIYFQKDDRSKAYEEYTPKLGFNTNVRSRFKIITATRKLLEDGSLSIRSRALLGEWETFALDAGKFQGIRGAHDDKVMAYCIAVEAWRVQMLSLELEENQLKPIWEGREVGPEHDDFDEEPEDISYVQKMINRTKEKGLDEPEVGQQEYVHSMEEYF